MILLWEREMINNQELATRLGLSHHRNIDGYHPHVVTIAMRWQYVELRGSDEAVSIILDEVRDIIKMQGGAASLVIRRPLEITLSGDYIFISCRIAAEAVREDGEKYYLNLSRSEFCKTECAAPISLTEYRSDKRDSVLIEPSHEGPSTITLDQARETVANLHLVDSKVMDPVNADTITPDMAKEAVAKVREEAENVNKEYSMMKAFI